MIFLIFLNMSCSATKCFYFVYNNFNESQFVESQDKSLVGEEGPEAVARRVFNQFDKEGHFT